MTDRPSPGRYETLLMKALDPRTVNPFLRRREPSIYPSFGDRVTACLLDCLWTMILLGPVLLEVHALIYGANRMDNLLAGIPPEQITFTTIIRSPLLGKFIAENLVTYGLTSIIVIAMWSYSSTTPGKWLLRMRIVRHQDHANPTMTQWFLRYLGYLTFFPGYLWIFADSKNRAWHDLFAGTVVVKVRHWRIRDDGTIPHLPPEEPLPEETAALPEKDAAV